VENHAAEKNGGINRYRIAQAVLKAFALAVLKTDELARFERPFAKANE
jgi:hypothetical protein